MSALVFKEKSTSNIKAALLLYENEYYGSSVHCYYYSSFQLTIFVLLNKFGLSHEELRNEAFDAKRSMHKYYINKVTGTISNLQKRRLFNDNINRLRNIRNAADYDPFITNQRVCEDAKRYNEN